MRPMNSLPAAAGLLLVLATGSFSAPIHSETSVGGHGGYWTVPATYDPWAPGWIGHRGHRSPGLAPRDRGLAKDHGGYGAANLPFGLGRMDEGYPIPSRLCGGAVGTGLSQYPLEGPDSETPDLDVTQPGDDGSDARIAATADLDRNANPIPAVPEPGSLAMLGAGALGLLAARGLLKDQ